MYISRIRREKPIEPISTKIGVFILVHDVITPSKFDPQILTGYRIAGVQSLGPPIYSVHRSYKQSPAIAGASDERVDSILILCKFHSNRTSLVLNIKHVVETNKSKIFNPNINTRL